MKNDFTKIACVLDRSGSMNGGMILEARNGFNNFVEEQKKEPGYASITVTIFDDKIEKLYAGNLENCPELTKENFFPRGMTSLYDAIGTTISSVGVELSQLAEGDRPGKVIVLIITDGFENSSREYYSYKIKDMIKEQREKYNWQFIFMGANEESIGDAKDLGIGVRLRYNFTQSGSRDAYSAMSASASVLRSGESVNSNTYTNFQNLSADIDEEE